ncbi:hypothetical protein V1514DRAFT_327644 [Lipomyces japonicus]|uniref:uncharacterized protein n=1 Tax=Lipomyces japonicus TaxID=56871 RepID=UPI0034CF51A9
MASAEEVKNVADQLAQASIEATAQPAVPIPAQPAAATADDKKQQPKKAKKAKKEAAGAGGGVPLEITPAPEFIPHRIQLFEELKKRYDDEIASKPRFEITVTLKDGSNKTGISWETTPFSIVRQISKSLADRTIISKVNNILWDLERPLEEDSTVEFFDFESPEGKRVFWHSSAHVLGEASERHYGCHLCIGPPTDDGFFYEMSITDRVVSQSDFGALETIAKSAIKEKQPFERLIVSKQDLLTMFSHNKYKQTIIDSKIPDGTSTTVYRCGPLIDLCVGPHVPHTGRIKAFKVLKNSASYFLGDANNDSLQRIYGVSFPDPKQMTEYLKFLEEAAKRDHRKIGRDQDLFFFHELSPGSAFWLPHGAKIYNTLVDLMRSEYRKRGYEEVITPNMFNSKLWETSGHWAHYKDDMFSINVEKETFALKPMNCPSHCLIFKSRERSYRELPWRVADFGVLHRNEYSGALTGLTRVRRFQQDDTHIFCTHDQIEDEIIGVFDFLRHIYGIFGFTFKLELSTRPEKYLGELATWDSAEKMLSNALNKFGAPWELNPGDGAFYGPKIDITIQDALRRSFQCATIQLDFQLPERFGLEYHSQTTTTTTDGNTTTTQYARPVMIHRAILGSVERLTAILTEHFAGKWPFWLSPRQALVVPVGPKYYDYATEVRQVLFDAGFEVDADLGPNTLPKKVRNGQLQQYNFLLIVGQEELDTRSVNARSRDDPATQTKGEAVALDEIIARFTALKQSRQHSLAL